MAFGSNVIQRAWGRMCEREGGRGPSGELCQRQIRKVCLILAAALYPCPESVLTTLLHVQGQAEDVPVQQIYTFVIFTHLTLVWEHPPQWNPASILVKAASAHPFKTQQVRFLMSHSPKPERSRLRKSFFRTARLRQIFFPLKIKGKVIVFTQLFHFAFWIFKQSLSIPSFDLFFNIWYVYRFRWIIGLISLVCDIILSHSYSR